MQVPDEAVTKCTSCSSVFNAFNRKVCFLYFVDVVILLFGLESDGIIFWAHFSITAETVGIFSVTNAPRVESP